MDFKERPRFSYSNPEIIKGHHLIFDNDPKNKRYFVFIEVVETEEEVDGEDVIEMSVQTSHRKFYPSGEPKNTWEFKKLKRLCNQGAYYQKKNGFLKNYKK